MTRTADEVVGFWREAGPRRWFRKDDAFDAAVREGFEASHLAAARGELSGWELTAEGALGLALLADQIPRNLYRGSAHAYATDPLALAVAERAVARGFDMAAEPLLRPFFYMPFHHREDGAAQARAVELCERHAILTGDQDTLRSAQGHADIIARFGRFPHRNAVLGRDTTAEEAAFLAGGGFKG